MTRCARPWFFLPVFQPDIGGEPLIAAQESIDDQIDRLIGRLSDTIWNDIDRPAHDPLYELLFPGGITFYTDGPDDEQPARMDLLADLLESNLHPKLDPKRAKQYAAELRGGAQTLEAAVDAARKPRAQKTPPPLPPRPRRRSPPQSPALSFRALRRHQAAALPGSGDLRRRKSPIPAPHDCQRRCQAAALKEIASLCP